MTKEMTGAEMVIEALADQGVKHLFGYPGGAVLPIYDALFQQSNRLQHVPGAPRAGRRARRRRLCALDRQGRLRAGDVRPRRHQRGHRPDRCAVRLDPAGRHHRAGADAPDRQRRLPGMRHGRHHAALHQAQLPGEEHQRFAAGAARGLSHRQERPAGSGGRRHPEGRAVRHRPLRQADRVPAQGLPAEGQGRPRSHQGRGRADGACQAAAVLHRRRRHQFRAGGEPFPARTGQAHRLPDHLDA